MTEHGITILVDSASRPDFVEQCLISLQQHLKFSGKLTWLFHEAVLRLDDSEKCTAIARESKLFSVIKWRIKPTGQGISISDALDMTQTPYFIYWVDDHLAIRDIDLDAIYDCFEANPDVNQITFNKRDTGPHVSGWFKAVVKKGNLMLTTSPHWRYMPAMWRMEWIVPRWQRFEGNRSHWSINDLLQGQDIITGKKVKTTEWVMENLGTYYLGPIDEKAYVKDIGRLHSQRSPEYINA